MNENFHDYRTNPVKGMDEVSMSKTNEKNRTNMAKRKSKVMIFCEACGTAQLKHHKCIVKENEQK